MNKKLFSAGLALALGAGCALNAFAQAKPEVLVRQRQSVMVLQGKYFGPLAGMAQGKVPYNKDTVVLHAAYLDALSRMPWDGFDPSTKDEKNTHALPAVYTDSAKFKEASERLQTAVRNLVAVSKTGDEAAVKGAIGDVGKACGNCHDHFRQKL